MSCCVPGRGTGSGHGEGLGLKREPTLESQGLLYSEPSEVEQTSEKPWHKDEGKPQFELIPQWGLLELAKVATYGRHKYSKHNYAFYANEWNWLEPMGSLLRHTFAFLRGEWLNDESGLAHLAHAAFNALLLIDLFVHGKGNDDRSPFAFMATVGDRNTPEGIEPMLAIGPETPKKWRRKMLEAVKEGGMDSWHSTLPAGKGPIETPDDPRVIAAQIEINKRLGVEVDDALEKAYVTEGGGLRGVEPLPLPDEELHHNELTFPPFAPHTQEYWARKLIEETERIMKSKSFKLKGAQSCGN